MGYFGYIFGLWGLSELILNVAARSKAGKTSERDKGTISIIWGTLVVSLAAGIFVAVNYPAGSRAQGIAGIALLAAGVALRWFAIISLGKMFTTNVTIQNEHRLKTDGLYSVLRHPSYTGLLISFLGMGLSMGNLVSGAIVFVPVTAAILYRIKVEEDALTGYFGEEYTEYKSRTKKLIPYIY
ncbi:MAG: isoprenylcysteine carboxylmethyltransferase family protein [Bacteroidetes bacterium]|nr:isoprenylcysteine carboxylmethyltransferase family protein [Bacteroidota bacterium]